MPKAWRHDIRFVLFEGLIVLFGVLAALFVDEWREDRQLRAEADAATASLLVEVEQNLQELIALESITTQRIALLREVQAEPVVEGSLADAAKRFGGYRVPDLRSSAWRRISTGPSADRMSQALLLRAFDLYTGAEYLGKLDDQISRLVFGELNYDPDKTRIALAIAERIMDQQIRWAKHYIELHESFLNDFGSGD